MPRLLSSILPVPSGMGRDPGGICRGERDAQHALSADLLDTAWCERLNQPIALHADYHKLNVQSLRHVKPS